MGDTGRHAPPSPDPRPARCTPPPCRTLPAHTYAGGIPGPRRPSGAATSSGWTAAARPASRVVVVLPRLRAGPGIRPEDGLRLVAQGRRGARRRAAQGASLLGVRDGVAWLRGSRQEESADSGGEERLRHLDLRPRQPPPGLSRRRAWPTPGRSSIGRPAAPTAPPAAAPRASSGRPRPTLRRRLRLRPLPAHRPGRDRPGHQRRPLPARPLAPVPARHVLDPRRASWSRASRWRRRSGARSWRRAASRSRTRSTAPPSPGRSRSR
jgi:hypothetical protein